MRSERVHIVAKRPWNWPNPETLLTSREMKLRSSGTDPPILIRRPTYYLLTTRLFIHPVPAILTRIATTCSYLAGSSVRLSIIIRTVGLWQITRSTEGCAEHKSEQSHHLAYSSSLRKQRKGFADGGDQMMTK